MRLLVTLLAACGLAVVAFASALAQSGGELKPGDTAPPFSLAGSDGKTYSLSAYKDKQAVVLAWFPKAFTAG
jgi:peroxiredoxin Q/BCP